MCVSGQTEGEGARYGGCWGLRPPQVSRSQVVPNVLRNVSRTIVRPMDEVCQKLAGLNSFVACSPDGPAGEASAGRRNFRPPRTDQIVG
jgi:hypothetical protein